MKVGSAELHDGRRSGGDVAGRQHSRGGQPRLWQRYACAFLGVQTSKTGIVTATQVNDTKDAAAASDFTGNLLLLPTGQVLWDDSQSGTEVAVYTPKGKPKAAWLPVVSSVNSKLTVGSTGNAISGTNFNGFDLGGCYGDDAQAATNYPLVRITNTATGDVCFGRSYNFSTMGVWTTGTTNATFDLPVQLRNWRKHASGDRERHRVGGHGGDTEHLSYTGKSAHSVAQLTHGRGNPPIFFRSARVQLYTCGPDDVIV